MELVLIRGLPGSGKSTYARRFYSGYVHCEADHYFYDKDGVYRYNPDLIRQAHAACQKKAREALRSGKSVVVSNTFVRQWEMLPTGPWRKSSRPV